MRLGESNMQNLKGMQNENIDKGRLQVDVVTSVNQTPIKNAKVELSYSGDPEQNIEEVNTNESGQTELLDLAAPPLEYSMEPSETQPFSQYTVRVTAEGYRPITVSGIEIFSDETALQKVRLQEENAAGNPIDTIVIPVNTLFGDEARQ